MTAELVIAETVVAQPPDLPADEPLGALEPVAYFNGAMPTGVAVSHRGRIFVNFPKWSEEVAFTVAELRDGELVPYPNEAINRADPGNPAASLVSVQSVVVDPADRLWILDTGSPMFRSPQYGGPKLVCVDLARNEVVRTILFPQDVAPDTSYLKDMRFDLQRPEAGVAYITDASPPGMNAIIVVDLASGNSWRRLGDHFTTRAGAPHGCLPVVEGRPFMEYQPDRTPKPVTIGASGIALGADGTRLYYCPLISRWLYSVETDALVDRSVDDKEVATTIVDEGNKGGAADGLESDADGNIYATSYEHNAVLRRRDGRWDTVVHDPHLLWPGTLCVARDGYLYVTASQLHRQARYNGGVDLRRKPYTLFRVRIDQQPVMLR
jgi:sugar lactone lactonase YvrE